MGAGALRVRCSSKVLGIALSAELGAGGDLLTKNRFGRPGPSPHPEGQGGHVTFPDPAPTERGRERGVTGARRDEGRRGRKPVVAGGRRGGERRGREGARRGEWNVEMGDGRLKRRGMGGGGRGGWEADLERGGGRRQDRRWKRTGMCGGRGTGGRGG